MLWIYRSGTHPVGWVTDYEQALNEEWPQGDSQEEWAGTMEEARSLLLSEDRTVWVDVGNPPEDD
jgi:hypothetical protein